MKTPFPGVYLKEKLFLQVNFCVRFHYELHEEK